MANLGRRRTEKVLGLLHLPERLAIAAAEYETHALEEAAEVFQQQLDIETAIRSHAPDIYEARWAEWLERDAALAHTPRSAAPRVRALQLLARRQEHIPWPPMQASLMLLLVNLVVIDLWEEVAWTGLCRPGWRSAATGSSPPC